MRCRMHPISWRTRQVEGHGHIAQMVWLWLCRKYYQTSASNFVLTSAFRCQIGRGKRRKIGARRHAVGGKRQAPCAVRRAFYETSLSL